MQEKAVCFADCLPQPCRHAATLAVVAIVDDFGHTLSKSVAAGGRACHLDQGQGSVGPNLTDDFWIHGCKPMDLLNTVNNGVAAKGMPAWLNQLGPSRTMSAVAYVLTLKDTNVPGKAPEGEPCVE